MAYSLLIHQSVELPGFVSLRTRQRSLLDEEARICFAVVLSDERISAPFRERMRKLIEGRVCKEKIAEELLSTSVDRGSVFSPFVMISSIPNAGFGLFAGRDYSAPSEYVIEYTGTVMSTEKIESDEYKTRYGMRISQKLSIDAKHDPWSGGRYVNHSQKPNARLVASARNKTAGVQLLQKGIASGHRFKTVERGEEILVHYGSSYWSNDEKHQVDDEISLSGHFLEYYDFPRLLPQRVTALKKLVEEDGGQVLTPLPEPIISVDDDDDDDKTIEDIISAPIPEPMIEEEEEIPLVSEYGPLTPGWAIAPDATPTAYQDMDEILSEPPPKRVRKLIPKVLIFEDDDEEEKPQSPRKLTPRPQRDFTVPHAIDIRPLLAHAKDGRSIPTTSRAVISFIVQHKLQKTHTNSECREDRFENTFLPSLNSRFLLPVIDWKDNSCFFDSLVLAAFGYSLAFDFLIARSIASATPLSSGRRAVRDELRLLITQIRANTGIPNRTVYNANVKTRVALNRQHLPLPITQQFGVEGACGATGDPSQLWNAIVSDVFESPLRAYCFKRSVYDRTDEPPVEIVKPLNSFSVLVNAFDDDVNSRDIGNCVLQAWRGGVNDSNVRTEENSGVNNPEILQAPHALVIEIGRIRKLEEKEEFSKNPVIISQTLELTHREKTVRYKLRSLVSYRPGHYVSYIRGPTPDDWVFVDALPGTNATTQVDLTGAWSAIVLDSKAGQNERADILAGLDKKGERQQVRSKIEDPWLTATMAFYEEEEFEELSRALLVSDNNAENRIKEIGIRYDSETSLKTSEFSRMQQPIQWEALFGTYVEEAISRIRSCYRKTESYRETSEFQTIRTLRPSRNYLALTQSKRLPEKLPLAIPPLQGVALNGPVDLLSILLIVRSEALDNLLSYTPPLVTEIERSYRDIWKGNKLLVPPVFSNTSSLATALQERSAPANVLAATTKWITKELSSMKHNEEKALSGLARTIRLRRQFINEFVNYNRTSYFYPAQECYDSATSEEKRKLLWNPFAPLPQTSFPFSVSRIVLGMVKETGAQTEEVAISTIEKLSGVIPVPDEQYKNNFNFGLWVPLENSFCVLSNDSHPRLDQKTFVPKLVKVFSTKITADAIFAAMLKIATSTRSGGGAVALFPFTFFVQTYNTATSIEQTLNYRTAFRNSAEENGGVRICTHGQEPLYRLSAVLIAEPSKEGSKWALLYKFAGSANTWYLHDTTGKVTGVNPVFDTTTLKEKGYYYVQNPFALLYEADDFDPESKYLFY